MNKLWLSLVVLALVGCSKNQESGSSSAVIDEQYAQITGATDFGSFSAKDAPVIKTFSLLNNSAATADLTPSIQESESPFAIVYSNCAAVARARTCNVKVRFNPQVAPGAHVAHLLSASDSFALQAEVMAPPASFQVLENGVVLSSVDFGVASGTQTIVKNLSLKNIGARKASVGALSASAGFSIVLNYCAVEVNVGSSCAVRVSFSASGKAPNTYSGSLSSDNGLSLALSAVVPTPTPPTPPPVSVSFVEGTAPVTEALDLGSLNPGQSLNKTLYLRNNSAAASPVGSLTLSGSALTIAYDNCSGRQLAPKSTCRLIVRFDAAGKAAGAYAGTLAFLGQELDLSAAVNGSVVCTGSQHLEGAACVENVQACALANGQGQKTWLGSAYGACVLVACNSSFHDESGACVSDIRACAIANGAGQETWLGNQYSACTAQSCNANFHLASNQCDANVISCTGEISNAASASKTWSGSAYGSCVLASCNSGYTVSGNACVSSGGNQAPVVAFDMYNLTDENDYIELYPAITDADGTIASVSVSVKKTAPSVVDPYSPNTSVRCVNVRGGSQLGFLNCANSFNVPSSWVEFRLNNDVGTYEITVTATDNQGASTSLTKTLINAANNHLLLSSQNLTVPSNIQAGDNLTGVFFQVPAAAISQNLTVHPNIEYRWRVRNQAVPACRYPVQVAVGFNNQRNYIYGVHGTNPSFFHTFDLSQAALTGSGCPNISNGAFYNIQVRIMDPTPTSRIVRFAGWNVRINAHGTPNFNIFTESDKKVQGGGSQYIAIFPDETLDPGEGVRMNFSDFSNSDGTSAYTIGYDLDNNNVPEFTRVCDGDCQQILDPAINSNEYFKTEVSGDGDTVCERNETCTAQTNRVIRMIITDAEGDINYRYWGFNLGAGKKPVVRAADGQTALIQVRPQLMDPWNPTGLPLVRMNGGPAIVTYDASAVEKSAGGACTGCLFSVDPDSSKDSQNNWPGANYQQINNGFEINNSSNPINTYSFSEVGQYLNRYIISDGGNKAVDYSYNIVTIAGSTPNSAQGGGSMCGFGEYSETYTISDGSDTWYPFVFWDQGPGDEIYEQWGYWATFYTPYGVGVPVNLHVIDTNFVHDIKSFNVVPPPSFCACEPGNPVCE